MQRLHRWYEQTWLGRQSDVRRQRNSGSGIFRYPDAILETCQRVDDTIKALSRIPIAVSQNVTLLDPLIMPLCSF
jgi:predicted choloylglycine hydrolase